MDLLKTYRSLPKATQLAVASATALGSLALLLLLILDRPVVEEIIRLLQVLQPPIIVYIPLHKLKKLFEREVEAPSITEQTNNPPLSEE